MSSTRKQLLPRITKILAVDPFKITTLWTNGEVRQIDFEPLWKQDNDSHLYPLFEKETFKEMVVSPTRTLQWPGVLIDVKLSRRTVQRPLDLDPDELYRQSILVRKTENLTIVLFYLKLVKQQVYLNGRWPAKAVPPVIIFPALKMASLTFK